MPSTKWIIKLDKLEAESALDWTRDFVSHYDISQLEEIRLSQGHSGSGGVSGRCWYPSQRSVYYRICCYVPGPFPHRIETRQPPIYRLMDGSWPPIPAGCLGGLYCEARANGKVREWRRVIGYTEVQSIGEGIVWIVAHEMFHFLRRTRQVTGRNTEIEADRFADDQLQRLRRHRGRWIRG